MQVNMRFIKSILYQLKRQYGASITLYKTTAYAVDPKTGKKNVCVVKQEVKLAIVLPDTLANKFAYEHSYLVANRKFTYGAQWDQRQRLVVIDGQDLPKDFTIEVETSLVFANERYVVRKADKFDVGYGYLLTVTRADNNLPLQILDFCVHHKICIGQEVDH